MDSTRPAVKPLFGYRKYWAQRFGTAPFLPMSRAEMDALGWDSCDIILVTGDAYIDHPSFGMALVGRLLEAQGFRVGIICQPDWHRPPPSGAGQAEPVFRRHCRQHGFDGQPLHRRPQDPLRRCLHARTPKPNKRPDRAVIVYAQRCREAYPERHVVIGGIEASLRRIAHYDYWSDKVRRSVLPDSKADLLMFGNAERAMVELAHRLAKGEKIAEHPRPARHGLHGAARLAACRRWERVDSTTVDTPGPLIRHADPYAMETGPSGPSTAAAAGEHAVRIVSRAERLAALEGQARPHRRSACRPTSRSATTRCSTPMPRASSTSNPIPATPARWSRRTASATSGSIRRRFR